jgi:hypothetical protein
MRLASGGCLSMDGPENNTTSHGTVGSILGLLSPSETGEHSGHGVAGAPPDSSPGRDDDPTERLPVFSPVPDQPSRPARTVAVITPAEPRKAMVFVPQRRLRRGFWILAIVVALLAGLMLGRTAVFGRTGADKQAPAAVAGPPPGYHTSPTEPTGAEKPLPVTGRRVTAPLGSATARRIEVVGVSTKLVVRSADLGSRLFSIATLDASAVPQVVNTRNGVRLELVRTGRAGSIGAEIQLNAKVRWTVALDGGSAEQDIDMRAGGLVSIDLAGGASRAVLRLPPPAGTMPLMVSGGVSELDILTGSGVPVRLRLGRGADTADLAGTTYRKVMSGATLASSSWATAMNRYDVVATAPVDSVHVDNG